MTILQRYVLREILAPIGFGLIVFTFVLLIGKIFQLTDFILNQGVSVKLTLELILLNLPTVMSLSIPMAILVGTLLGVGRLAADREILAIKAGGVNLIHVCIPGVVFATIICALLMFANSRLIPYFKLRGTDLTTQVAFNILTSIPPGTPQEIKSSGQNENMVFYFDEKDEATGKMKNIVIRTEYSGKSDQLIGKTAVDEKKTTQVKEKNKRPKTEEERLKERIARREKEFEELQNQRLQEILFVANTGEFVPNIQGRVINIVLSEGSIHLTNPDKPGSYDIFHFDNFQKGIVPQFKRFGKGFFEKSEEEMNNGELRDRIDARARSEKFKVELYRRFSVPIACIGMALLAFPLAVFVRPTGKALAFALSFILILVYYGLLQYGVALAEKGHSLGGFAIFFPNILLLIIGIFLIYRMVKR